MVVDGEIAAGSMYRNYRRLWMRRGIPEEAAHTARLAIEKYRPTPVFVIDVAETDDGFKIVEYGTFNSAGLYACDVAAVIDAINDFVEKSED